MKHQLIYLIALFACFPAAIFGQATLNVLDLYHDSSFSVHGRTVESKAAVGETGFHILTGGISFEAVARPAVGAEGEEISLDYTGGRFTMTVGGQTYEPQLPEWQLFPIVNFVESPYQVAFSSLGDTVDHRQARLLYHPAFLNTLLGLRIFEADILNIPGVLWDLPRDGNGRYLLAKSEEYFVPHKDSVLNLRLYDELCGEGRPFSSFILTDRDAEITFGIEDGRLVFAGHPYYLFTKNTADRNEIRELRERIEQYYRDIEDNASIFLGDAYTPEINPHRNMTGLVAALEANKSKAPFNPFPYRRLKADIAKLDSLQSLGLEDLGVKIELLSGFSADFNRNWELLKRYNPVVYSAVENVSRWAALFRYIKRTNPDNWAVFRGKISGRRPKDAPEVKTPTWFEIDYIRIFSDRIEKREIF